MAGDRGRRRILRGSYHLYQGFGALPRQRRDGHHLRRPVPPVGPGDAADHRARADRRRDASSATRPSSARSPGCPSGRPGRPAEARSARAAPGRLASVAPGSASFDRRTPLPMTTAPACRDGLVHEHRPVGGQPDRGDAAVLHPGQLDRGLHRANEALRTSSSRLTRPFTSALVVAQHHARGHPRSRRHAARPPPRSWPTRLSATPYRSQNAAVSASVGIDLGHADVVGRSLPAERGQRGRDR